VLVCQKGTYPAPLIGHWRPREQGRDRRPAKHNPAFSQTDASATQTCAPHSKLSEGTASAQRSHGRWAEWPMTADHRRAMVGRGIPWTLKRSGCPFAMDIENGAQSSFCSAGAIRSFRKSRFLRSFGNSLAHGLGFGPTSFVESPLFAKNEAAFSATDGLQFVGDYAHLRTGTGAAARRDCGSA
jgi:hypothetical protein